MYILTLFCVYVTPILHFNCCHDIVIKKSPKIHLELLATVVTLYLFHVYLFLHYLNIVLKCSYHILNVSNIRVLLEHT